MIAPTLIQIGACLGLVGMAYASSRIYERHKAIGSTMCLLTGVVISIVARYLF